LKPNRLSDRRSLFIAALFLRIILPFFPAHLSAQLDTLHLSADTDDQMVARRLFSFAFEHKLIAQPIGKVMTAVGNRFIGSPYEENTLDRYGDQRLVVNLNRFDCVTFVENVLALSRAIKGNRLTFDFFQQQLEGIRYRNGVRNGYESRLNYFSEWISDNTRKGYIRNLTDSLGGRRIYKPVNFLSLHGTPSITGVLADSSIRKIRETEQMLTADSLSVIPAGEVSAIVDKIEDGDVIAFTTKTAGLDVGHTGIAVRDRKGVVHLLHASESGKRVVITPESLVKYLAKHHSDTGILVARPLAPRE
jgi:hypothetical protein